MAVYVVMGKLGLGMSFDCCCQNQGQPSKRLTSRYKPQYQLLPCVRRNKRNKRLYRIL